MRYILLFIFFFSTIFVFAEKIKCGNPIDVTPSCPPQILQECLMFLASLLFADFILSPLILKCFSMGFTKLKVRIPIFFLKSLSTTGAFTLNSKRQLTYTEHCTITITNKQPVQLSKNPSGNGENIQ